MSATRTAIQRLERCGSMVAEASSVSAFALMAFKAAESGTPDGLLLAESLLRPAMWRAAAETYRDAGAHSYVTDHTLRSVVGACAFAAAVLLSDRTELRQFKDSIHEVFSDIALFTAAIRRNLVDMESRELRSIIVANASAAFDVAVLCLRSLSEDTALARHIGGSVEYRTSLRAAAESLADAAFSQALWCFAGDPNNAALAKAQPSVVQLLVENRQLPGAPDGATMVAARATMGHNRPLPVKLALYCADPVWKRDINAPPAPCVRAALGLLSAIASTPSARAAVFYRFDDELMLMNNTSAADCRLLLSIFQRAPFVLPNDKNPSKKATGAAPVTLAKAVAGFNECVTVIEGVFTAFVLNRHWRSYATERRRLLVAQAAARPGSAAASVVLGAGSTIQANALTTLGEKEDAIGRLSHGAAALPKALDDTMVLSNASLAEDSEAAHDSHSDADNSDGKRSDGGYSHLSARTAATTMRGRAVVEAVKDLFLDASLQRPSDGGTNVALPLVLLELCLSWVARALDAVFEVFPNATDKDDDDDGRWDDASGRHWFGLAEHILGSLSSLIAIAAHPGVFAVSDDTRFNASLGLRVFHDAVLGGLVLPLLPATAATVTAPNSSRSNVGLRLCEVLRRAHRTPGDLLQHTSAIVGTLDSVVPAALHRHLASFIVAFAAPPATADAAEAVSRTVAQVLQALATRLGASQQLPLLVESIRNALLDPDTMDRGALLARILTDQRHEAMAAHEPLLQAAVQEGAGVALDPEALVVSVRGAVGAAITCSSTDEALLFRAPALARLAAWVVTGLRVNSISALPLLELLVELDVEVAVHVAAQVERLSAVDAALAAASTAYDAKPTFGRLRRLATAYEDTMMPRRALVLWMELLEAVRAQSMSCAQDLGVFAPETFLRVMDETVWQYSTAISTIVAPYSSVDALYELLCIPADPLPCADVIDDPVLAATIHRIKAHAADINVTMRRTLIQHVGQRLVRGAAVLGVLLGGGENTTEDKYLVRGLVVSGETNYKAAKKMAALVHRLLLDEALNGCDEQGVITLLPPSVCEIAFALHPSSGSDLHMALAERYQAAAERLASGVTRALPDLHLQSVAAVSELFTATKKQLLSRSKDDALVSLYGGPDAVSCPGKEAFIAACDVLRASNVALATLLSVQGHRGGLPGGGNDTLRTLFRWHRDVLERVLRRPELLGLIARPGSALSDVVSLISLLRRNAADALKLGETQRNPNDTRQLVGEFCACCDNGNPTEPSSFTAIEQFISDCVSTVSVDEKGTCAFLKGLVGVLLIRGSGDASSSSPPPPLGWTATRRSLVYSILAALTSAASAFDEQTAQLEDVTRFLTLVSELLAVPRFAKLFTSPREKPARRGPRPEVVQEPHHPEEEGGAADDDSSSMILTAPIDVFPSLVASITRLCAALLRRALPLESTVPCEHSARERAIRTTAATLRGLMVLGVNLHTSTDVAAVEARALHEQGLVHGLTVDAAPSVTETTAAACLTAAWAIVVAGGIQGEAPTVRHKGEVALGVHLLAFPEVQRLMQFASESLQGLTSKWLKSITKSIGHAVTEGLVTVRDAATALRHFLTLPNVKIAPVKTMIDDVLTAALQCGASSDVEAVLCFCRLPLAALHKNNVFLHAEIAVVTHAFSLPQLEASALAAACRLLIMLLATFTDELIAVVNLLPSVVRLLTRATLSGLRESRFDSSAASLLSAVMYHLSRPRVLSLTGRQASGMLAAAMVRELYGESAKYLSVAAQYSVELDTCGFDLIRASKEKQDIVFGALAGDPQAQWLFRKATLRLEDTQTELLTIDPGLAMPQAQEPAVSFGH